MKRLLLTVAALTAALSLTVGLAAASAASMSAAPIPSSRFPPRSWATFSSTGAATPCTCSRRTSAARVPAPGSAPPTGLR